MSSGSEKAPRDLVRKSVKANSSCKRTWHAIVCDILEATLTPEKKTRIMNRVNLNFTRFNSYFYDLKDKGFIEEVLNDDDSPLFRISEKGKTLLTVLREARSLFFGGE